MGDILCIDTMRSSHSIESLDDDILSSETSGNLYYQSPIYKLTNPSSPVNYIQYMTDI